MRKPLWVVGLAIALVAAFVVMLLQRRADRSATQPSAAPTVEPAVAAPDAIVVGSGIAGLSAAYELAQGGASVLIVDMASVFGGHAVMATGDR